MSLFAEAKNKEWGAKPAPHFFDCILQSNWVMLNKMKRSAARMNLKAIILFIGIVALGSSADPCVGQRGNDRSGEEGMPEKTIEEVLKKYTPELMSKPGVVGTGQSLCEGQPCIKVFVAKETPELKEEIPDTLEGYPVVIKESGKFRAIPKK
jgi:hypothetical protein